MRRRRHRVSGGDPVSERGGPFWISAFLDQAPGEGEASEAFWAAVTGTSLSTRRGDDGEFATLVPADGDDHLRVQRLADGPRGVHLDLHVDDVRASADRLAALGAVEVADLGHIIMRSPGGMTFCLVTHPCRVRTSPVVWPDGHRSLVDQVCLDVPSVLLDAETAFWSLALELDAVASATASTFRPLRRDPALPLRILLQDVGAGDVVRAHLDLATDDRAVEVARHGSLGAQVVGEHARWTVLADPVGRVYCVTDRDPSTGLLP